MNDQELWQWTSAPPEVTKSSALDPDGVDDDQGLGDYLEQLVAPDKPQDDYDSSDAHLDSLMLGQHLAMCKVQALRGDHAKLEQHLNKTLAYHRRLHGAIARANAIREKQEQD